MKLATVLSVLLLFAASAFAETGQELATQGQRAYMSGDVETAKTKFREALEVDPGNRVASGYMRMIAAQEAKSGGGAGIEKQLRSVVLPEVKFKDATFAQALEYLKQAAAKQSVNVSFVLKPEVDRDAKVTLNLSSVPFLEALRYTCEMASVQFAIEKFAIVIKK